MANANAFCEIEGAPGESTDDAHSDWIEILAWNHGIHQEASASTSGTGSAGAGRRCDHAPFSITKQMDKSSVKLNEFCCNGETIPTVTVSLCHSGGDKFEFMKIVLTDVVISDVSVSAGAETPVETVNCDYGKIEWTYNAQKRADGTGGGTVAAGWDLAKNVLV